MPSASKGETCPKRLPRPGTIGVEGLEVVEFDHPPDLGRDEDDEEQQAEADRAPRRRAGDRGAIAGQPDRHPDHGDRPEPERPRIAVGVGGADRDQGRRDEAQRQLAPGGIAPRLPQGEDEGEHEERLHRLLEGALGEVGGDHVGEADEQRAGESLQPRQLGEGRERGETGEDGDREGEAVEALDEADPQALAEGDDDRVRAERVALAEELGALAVQKPVAGQQMLGHVRVEAGAEDSEVAFDQKRDAKRPAGRRDPTREPLTQRGPGAIGPGVDEKHRRRR